MMRNYRQLLCLLAGFAGAQAHAQDVQDITLNGAAGGKRFDGIGVVDGGGATSVLLKDYPDPQRSQILDLIYKPKFGASVSALLVEVPGDGNATQGSMPSHMHTRDDLNYRRGYTWWIMREAKARNPHLSLDGAAWSAPGWLGQQGARFPQNTKNVFDAAFFSQDTVDYYVKWLRGLRDVHGLGLDAIGVRNEKGASYDFAKAFRRGLDANGFDRVRLHAFDNWPDDWKLDFVRDMPGDKGLRDAIDIIGAHINAPKSRVSPEVQTLAEQMGKPIWNTEQHVYLAGYDGLIGIVEAFNENYIRSGATKIVNWYGIAALYPIEPYSGEKEAALRAHWPWSGHFSVNPSLWGYAHYGQFSAIGWQYLRGGSGDLVRGGTYVTLKSPGADYSVIVETKDAAGPQQVRIALGGGLAATPLAVWRSDRTTQFVRQPDLVARGGAVTLTLEPDAVYSLTSTRGQRKGDFASIPAPRSFPFPYRDTFDGYGKADRWGYLPQYFADIAGAFELSGCPGRQGGCLRQMAPVPTISWAPDWKPYTIIGDAGWRDYEVATDVYLGRGETAAVMGRVSHVGTGYGFIPKGYYLELNADGQLRLVVSRGKVNKTVLVGDAEQQALIKAGKDAGEGGEKLLATARLASGTGERWHRLALRFEGSRITGFVDGRPAIQASDSLYDAGMAGLLASPNADRLGMPYFDDVAIKAPGASDPAPRRATRAASAIYPAGARHSTIKSKIR